MIRPLLTTRQMALPLAIGMAMPMMAGAQATTTTNPSTPSTTAGPTSSTRLAASYATWAGSTANAQSLVSGLSTGSKVNLNNSAGSATFSPSTGKLGVGETGIALSLAKASLAEQGITKPTPEQISAALNGGIITSPTGTMSVPGVLSQRTSGMGWGQIAQAMGVKLGAVVSASKTDKSKAAQGGTHHDEITHKEGEREHAKESHGKQGESHRSGNESHGSSGRESHSGGSQGGGGHGGSGGGGKK